MAIAATALVGASPAAAEVNEAVVPPSNSAAAQYTEAFPTSGGDKKTDGRKGQNAPAAVLGRSNVRKLERQGPDGRAVATVTAATAPVVIETTTREDTRGSEQANEPAAGKTPTTVAPTTEPAPTSPAIAQPDGSDGVGEVLGRATGLSAAGQSGLLLLIVVLGTIVWALAYAWRQRQQVG